MERTAPLEVRLEGRTLRGVALRYGEPARDRREMFQPGAFQPLGVVALNLQHDPFREIASTDGGSLRVEDTPTELRIEADLREGSAELSLVRRRALRGLSVEFRAKAEHHDNGFRVIEKAALPGIGLVDSGSYRSEIEVRQLNAAAIVGVIPTARDMECTCQGPECDAVRFLPGAFDDLLSRSERGRDVLAIAGRATEVLGSLRRGTLRVARAAEATLRAVDAPRAKVQQGIEVVLDQAVTRAASTVIANSLGAPWYVRPLIRQATSDFIEEGRVRVYRRADVRAFLVKPTVNDKGHLPAMIEGRLTGPVPPALTLAEPEAERRRRRWL